MTVESITAYRRTAAADSNLSLDILRILCEESGMSDKDIRAKVAPTPIENLRVHLLALCEAGLVGTFAPGDTIYYFPTEAGRKRMREIDQRTAGVTTGGAGAVAWLFVSIVVFVIAALTYSSCR